MIPEDIDYPSLQLNVNRQQAAILGLTEKDVVDGVITALTSNGMIAPSYWVDPKSGQQLHADSAVLQKSDSEPERL